MSINKEDSDAIYIMRAIGIIAVVIGHHWGILFGLTKPYLYHMPLFFFVSGVFIQGANPLKSSIKTTLKISWYIVITYIIIGLFSVWVSSNFGSSVGVPFSSGIISTISLAISENFHNNQMFLVAWFLFAYLISFILVNYIMYFINALNIKNKNTFLLIVGTLSGFLSVSVFSVMYKDTAYQLFNIVSQVLYATMFMIYGNVLCVRLFSVKYKFAPILIILLVLSLYYSGISKSVVMSWSDYPSGFLVSTSVAMMCIYLISSLSTYLSKKRFSKPLVYTGKKSREVMSYHIVCFVMLDIFFYYLGVWDISKTTALEHYKSNISQFFYILIGVSVPVVIVYFYEKIIINKVRFS